VIAMEGPSLFGVPLGFRRPLLRGVDRYPGKKFVFVRMPGPSWPGRTYGSQTGKAAVLFLTLATRGAAHPARKKGLRRTSVRIRPLVGANG